MIRKTLISFATILFMALPGMVYAADLPLPAEPEMLSLDRCLELAAQNSQTVKAAQKKVEIVAAAVTEAKGAYWPKLDYTLFADKAHDPMYPYDASIYPEASKDESGAILSLTQELYSGGESARKLRLAKIQLDMARENERQAKQQLTFQVKQTFYQVWLAEQVLKVAETSLDNLEHHVKRTESLYHLGTVSKFELLRAKVERDSIKPQVIEAQNDQQLAKLNLAILIGFTKGRLFWVDFDSEQLNFPAQSQLVIEKLLESAYENRPEMHQAKQAETLSRYQKDLAEAGLQPKIFLTGQYEVGSLDDDPGHWADNKLWTLSLNITGNIFDGFTTPAKIEGAQKKMELTAIQETGLRDQIRLDVEQAAQNIQESLEVIHANQSNMKMAKESLKQTKDRFDEGLATTMDIMDSQLALDQALNGYYRGVALYLTAEAKLDLVDGKD
jgi:outer membrane protein